MKDTFQENIKRCEGDLNKTRSRYSIVGYGKLLLFVNLAFLVYFTIKNEITLGYVLLVFVLFIALSALWIYQYKLKERMNYYEGIIGINEANLKRMDGGWNGFEDDGSEFADGNHPYAVDLDIVGGKSLFQALNRARSW